MNRANVLAVLSDAIEQATGEAVDLSQWDFAQLLRVIRNPGAVYAAISARRVACCRLAGEPRPDPAACRQRLALERLIGVEATMHAVREERERQIAGAGAQPVWRRQLEDQWALDAESFAQWRRDNGVES